MKNNEREVKKSLECVIPPAQLKEYGKMLSGENQRKGRLENEMKSIASKFKAQIMECDSNIERYSQLLQSEREMKDVNCIITFNHPEEGYKTTVRADTGERVTLEPMTPGEMEDLFINCLGLQTDENTKAEYFTFHNRSSVLVANRDADDFSSAGWKTVFGPVNDREMVKSSNVNIENSSKYRVIRGLASDGKTVFSLQEKIELALIPEPAKEKKERKAKAAPATVEKVRCEVIHEKTGLQCTLDKGHAGDCFLNMCKHSDDDGASRCILHKDHDGEHKFMDSKEIVS